MTKLLDVPAAAKKIGIAPSTVRGMIARGELPHTKDASGRVWLEAADVAATPRRSRGRQPQDPKNLIGRLYKSQVAKLGSIQEVADKYQLTHQAVSDAIARYEAASRR